jgi:hypothetical protein
VTQHHDVTIEPVTAVLIALRITGTTRCISRPGEDVATAGLWEDARAALTATVVTRRTRGQLGTVVRFIRKLNPRTLRVVDEQRSERMGGVDRAFRAVPAEELSRLGYARFNKNDGTADYFAPDAEVLLSDVFLADHCFGVERRDSSGTRLVGLSFQPVPGRKIPDVRGVLWLDDRSAELKSLDYAFTELPGPRSRVSFGGRVEFMRLPSGSWVVRHWYIRMPVYTIVRRNPDPGIPGSGIREEQVLDTVQEEGGDVVLPGESRRANLVRGMVHDSTTGRGLAGARVVARGTAFSANTDPTGSFTLSNLAEGQYAFEVMHPRLDTLGARVVSEPVGFGQGEEKVVMLALPSMRTLRAQLCPGVSLDDNAGVLRVLAPARNATFMASWKRYAEAAGGLSQVETGADVQTDSLGTATLCAIPPTTLVRFRSTPGTQPIWRDSVRVMGGGVQVHLLHP